MISFILCWTRTGYLQVEVGDPALYYISGLSSQTRLLQHESDTDVFTPACSRTLMRKERCSQTFTILHQRHTHNGCPPDYSSSMNSEARRIRNMLKSCIMQFDAFPTPSMLYAWVYTLNAIRIKFKFPLIVTQSSRPTSQEPSFFHLPAAQDLPSFLPGALATISSLSRSCHLPKALLFVYSSPSQSRAGSHCFHAVHAGEIARFEGGRRLRPSLVAAMKRRLEVMSLCR